MRIDVVTLFPELFGAFLQTSFVGKAIEQGRISVRFRSPREFGLGVHRSVDDTPYGGGSGMVMRVDCLVHAMEAMDGDAQGPVAHRVLMCPQGQRFDQEVAYRFAKLDALMLICGRYEGFDERVRGYVDEQISLGDFVLSGGEVSAMAVIEAVTRLLPGVLGNHDSVVEESFSAQNEGLLEYPQYTRPSEFRGQSVEPVLLSGDHGKIAAWRREQSLARTKCNRPDLLGSKLLGENEKKERRDRGCGEVRRVSLALVHYPVVDRHGEVVTTAITNLDLHDIARSARVFGLQNVFVVHPVAAQRQLALHIQEHWTQGTGGRRIPDRVEPMRLLRVVESLFDVFEAMGGRDNVQVWTTSAKSDGANIYPYRDSRTKLQHPGKAVLLLFGTGWGLAPQVLNEADVRLEPIGAQCDAGFRHLSVRAACAITLDRLLGAQ